MKKMVFAFSVLALVLLVIMIAGCTSPAPGSSPAASSGSSGQAASQGNAAASQAPAASGGTCPAVTSATSWAGKWASWSYSDACFDARVHFYPPTADAPDPWDETFAGVEDFPVSFTQNGCDISGSITVGQNGTLVAPPGCPITLTGTVDSTGAAAGTWHAYCNIQANGASSADGTTDQGIWSLNMEPGGSTFVGTFGPSMADTTKYKADNCASANSNWVGKRA